MSSRSLKNYCEFNFTSKVYLLDIDLISLYCPVSNITFPSIRVFMTRCVSTDAQLNSLNSGILCPRYQGLSPLSAMYLTSI